MEGEAEAKTRRRLNSLGMFSWKTEADSYSIQYNLKLVLSSLNKIYCKLHLSRHIYLSISSQ